MIILNTADEVPRRPPINCFKFSGFNKFFKGYEIHKKGAKPQNNALKSDDTSNPPCIG
jgi:hypothetical protein